MMLKSKVCLVLLAFSLSSCAASGIVNIKCPSDPRMKTVEVKNGKIVGKSVENVKLNHIKLWKQIHILKRLGCKQVK